MTTTYTKLRDGSWGLRVQGQATDGQQVVVAKKDGARKVETVGRVLWRGEGVTLCSIRSGSRSGHGHHQRHASEERCYRGHRAPVAGCRDCFDTFDS